MSAIKRNWTEKTINLADTILHIIRHTEINKRNEENLVGNVKILAIGTPRPLKGTCIT